MSKKKIIPSHTSEKDLLKNYKRNNNMKEAKLIEMVNKINKLEETMSLVISDLRNINSIAVGTLETIKRMPDYQEAID